MRQPSPSPPTTQSAGILAPSMKTSLKCATPVIWFRGRTSTPGWRMGRTSIEMPACFGTSQSVRASRMPKSA